MPYSVFGASKGPLGPSASTTLFFMLDAYLQNIASEGNAEYRIPVAGTFKFAYVYLDANVASGGSQVLTLRKNAADTALVVNVVNGSTTYEHSNLSDTVHVDAGDMVCWKYVTTAVGSSVTIRGIYVCFLPDDTNLTLTPFAAGIFSSPPSIAAAQNNIHMISGRLTSGENLALPVNREVEMLIPGTLENWGMRSPTGGRALQLRTWKNQTDDGIDRCTFADNVTGNAFYNSNPISVVAGDDIIHKINVESTGTNRNWYNVYMYLKNSAKKSQIGFYDQGGSNVLAATGSTTYYSILHGGGSNSTTESRVAFKMPFDCVLSNMSAMLGSNTTNSGSSTIRLRKNGANGNQLIIIAAGASDNTIVRDDSNTDTIAAGDTVCIEFNPAGTSGIIAIMWLGIIVEDSNTYAPSSVDAISDYKDILKQRPQQLITNSI